MNPVPISANDRELVELATAVRERAYAPYSNYLVGAALRAKDGRIFTGCNVENAAYPSTLCAERTALVKAVSEGAREFETIAVVALAKSGPCGGCLQMLYEFAPDLHFYMADPDGNVSISVPMKELLPYGFGPEWLR
ncbi:MAG: cytidine deaminase [Anaerolineaceae bacterium]|nr:cytidine deaminase [Anaerolineaceae bacterium]MCY4105716.1 cytidine deaminase [Chloroflexota bacterium]